MTEYIRTQQLRPNTIADISQWCSEVSREMTLHQQFKAVPAQDQTNVRNSMYLASEALQLVSEKSINPASSNRIDHAE